MSQVLPEQAQFLLHGVYLPGMKNEHRATKSVIQAIPHDKGDYRPDGISKGALELAWHLVAAEMRFMGAVQTGAFDLSPHPRPEAIQNSADLVSWYADHFEEHFQKLHGLSNEQLTQVIEFRGMFQLPAVMYLGFMLHHTVHHRGQLTMYLRPMGAKVPAVYGESFDSAEARRLQQKPVA